MSTLLCISDIWDKSDYPFVSTNVSSLFKQSLRSRRVSYNSVCHRLLVEHGITDRLTSNYGVHKGLRWFVFRFVSIYRVSSNECLIIDDPVLLAFAHSRYMQRRAQLLIKKYTEFGIADFDEISHECSFQKHIWLVFFLSAVVDVEGVKTALKVGNATNTFCQISRKLLKISFLRKSMKLVFFNDEFNNVYRLSKRPFL